MVNGISMLFLLTVAVAWIAGALITVSLWRSESSRKWFYIFLTFYPVLLVFVSERLFTLITVPAAWQNTADGALFVPATAGLIGLYRHRHDPDPADPDVP